MKLKKPKFWDYKKPNFLSNILFPISKFYELILKFQPTKSMRKIDTIKTICVGNIYIGGTGKTSFAIELMKLCKKMQIKACFIKKFYSDQIDEQKLLEKFGKTFVNKSRLQALNEAAKNEFEIAIFDDGLQDKSILYDVSFVCFNGKNMFGNSRLIPSGPLRESLDNLIKYKNVVINGNQNNQFSVKSLFSKSIDKLNFFNGSYQPNNLSEFNLEETYLVFSGIGNHDTFLEMLNLNKFKIVKDLEYPDHHNYSKKNIRKILDLAKSLNAKILTTEKDYLRLDKNFQTNINFIKVNLKIDQLSEIKNRLSKLYESN